LIERSLAARAIDSCKIDKPALDVDGEQLHTNLIADIGTLEPADDASLGGEGEETSPCA
jgi:hypothetical protein